MNYKDEQVDANRTKNEAKGCLSNTKGVNHMTTIQKWGNSLAVRIPTHYAKDIGVQNGSEVELELINGGLVLKPVKTKLTLSDLLSQVKGPNPHLDYDLGGPEGKELL
jgi:antitoxin MazE